MSWQQYTALARRLDTARRDEATQAAELKQETESGRVGLDRLVDRLTEQQAALHEAAHQLRTRMPQINPAPSSALTAREALTRAQAAADTSESEREYALNRAQQPQLLPHWSTTPRNAVVYASCAGVALVLQVILMLLSGQIDATTVALWSLCGLPVIAFFVGYLVIGIVGVPRIPPKPAERDDQGRVIPPKKRMAPQLDRTPKLGFAICFLTLPVFWLLITLFKESM
ncbi:MAG: PspA/IM30 family protein [Micromonosporaceae bacterium]